MVTCKPYAQTENDHQCLLLASPYQAAVRVFDVTDNQFVLSPIAYFPLVIQVGEEPHKIATIDQGSGPRIFTLDPVAKAIYEIPSNFISPIKTITKDLGFSANDFVLATGPDGKIVAFVLQSDTGITEVALEGQTLETPFSFTGPVNHFQINPTATYLLVTNGPQLIVVYLKGPAPKITPVNPAFPASIASITSDATKALVALSDKTLMMVDLATATIESTLPTELKDKLTTAAAALYLPGSLPGEPSTCCNGESNWVAALFQDGTLQYFPYDRENKIFKTPQVIDILLATGVGSLTLTKPTKLLGASVLNPPRDGLGCERRLFLIYLGSIFNTCEGNSNIKRIDQMEN